MEQSERERQKKEQEKQDISSLRSGNKRAITDTLQKLRQRGSVAILPEIFELMLITEDEEILASCRHLLNDLKNEEVIPVIADAIKDPRFVNIRKDLIASCWQSGLDYHPYVDIFTDAAIDADYATTLEAFTVIEDSIGQVSPEEKEKILQKLKGEVRSVSDQKKPLIAELINMISRF